MLTATAMDIGTYWHSGPNINSEEMREYLGLTGPNDQCYGFLTVGYSSKVHPDGVRKPMGDKVRYVHK